MSSAVKRFRFMALVAGVMSLLLWFVDLPVVYLFNNPDWKAAVAWIPFVHGWSILGQGSMADEEDYLADLGRNPSDRIYRCGAQSCSTVFVNSSNL